MTVDLAKNEQAISEKDYGEASVFKLLRRVACLSLDRSNFYRHVSWNESFSECKVCSVY